MIPGNGYRGMASGRRNRATAITQKTNHGVSAKIAVRKGIDLHLGFQFTKRAESCPT
jgi:hypothetical protein